MVWRLFDHDSDSCELTLARKSSLSAGGSLLPRSAAGSARSTSILPGMLQPAGSVARRPAGSRSIAPLRKRLAMPILMALIHLDSPRGDFPMIDRTDHGRRSTTPRIGPEAWHALADRVLAGAAISTRRGAGRSWPAPTRSCSICWPRPIAFAGSYFGNRVQLYFLMNAKSGLCPEDCGYCSQSKVSDGRDSALQPAQRRKAARRRPRRRRAAGQDLLHRDLGPRTHRARDGRDHHDRAADQVAIQPEDLRLPGPADARAGRSG